ncbi:MAG: DUF2934 domain-containing protein [Acidobacteria bacterium]|nr:DUF2934 domain-containing protein [Acidobacteriota bacterium]
MAVKRSSGLKSKAASAAAAAPAVDTPVETPVVAKPSKARSITSRSTLPRTSNTVKHKAAMETESAASAAATLAQAVATEPTSAPQEEIARLAYFYWQERGCPHGDSMQDWLHAEQEVLTRYQAQLV